MYLYLYVYIVYGTTHLQDEVLLCTGSSVVVDGYLQGVLYIGWQSIHT